MLCFCLCVAACREGRARALYREERGIRGGIMTRLVLGAVHPDGDRYYERRPAKREMKDEKDGQRYDYTNEGTETERER